MSLIQLSVALVFLCIESIFSFILIYFVDHICARALKLSKRHSHMFWV